MKAETIISIFPGSHNNTEPHPVCVYNSYYLTSPVEGYPWASGQFYLYAKTWKYSRMCFSFNETNNKQEDLTGSQCAEKPSFE